MSVPSPLQLPFPPANSRTSAQWLASTGTRAVELSGHELHSLIARQTLDILHTAGTAKAGLQVILATSCPLEMAIGALATWQMKGEVVLPPNLREKTISELSENLRELHPQHTVIVQGATELSLRGHDSLDPTPPLLPQPVSLEQNLVTCFTSGTTGKPEAVRKSARQLLGEAKMLAELFMNEAQPRPVVCSVPAHHLYGFLFGVLAPLYAGGILVGGGGPERPSLQRLASGLSAPHFVSVPVHLRSLLASNSELLAGFSTIYSSSAPLSEDVGHGLRALPQQPRLVEIFGSSETGGIAFRDGSPGQNWKPLPQVEVSVNDEGLLALKSPFTSAGPKESVLCPDQIEMHADGFQHLGRCDGVIKVGGKRVSLQELEARAATHPALADVACLRLRGSPQRREPIAMVLVPKADSAAPDFNEAQLTAEIRAHLRTHFDDVLLPRRFRVVPTLPRNENGKLVLADVERLFHPVYRQLDSLNGFVDYRLISVQPEIEAPNTHLEYQITTSPDQEWFRGHFPDYPVLPGVVQLHSLVLGCAQEIWPQCTGPSSQRQIKFRLPIQPEFRLAVRLDFSWAQKRLLFVITAVSGPGLEGPVPAASGAFHFDA